MGLLAGVLNGAAFGDDVVDHRVDWTSPTNSGQAIFVMRPDLFGPVEAFKKRMDHHVRALRESPAMIGETIRMPGEEAARREQEALRLGVPVREPVLMQLRELAAELGLEERLE